ncbi:glycoside hydrolase [Opitutaceae bacterium EW11]|nr:glycoside hydrolase [Opitutaceae bacterium EW11]
MTIARLRSPLSLVAVVLTTVCLLVHASSAAPNNSKAEPELTLNASEYLEMPGLNVMLAQDVYPEGHQGGVGVILNGERVATNGDLRLEPTPGQWQPVPKVGKREVDRTKQEISVRLEYPDPSKDRKGFNPVVYPDLKLAYTVRVRPEGKAFRIVVDLDQPLPDAWVGKVGFNLELFPGILFGKSYYIGDHFGIFPRQPNGPGSVDDRFREPLDPLATGYELAPFGTGKHLVIAPESDRQRMAIESIRGGDLELLDGRAQHTNGWFVVRALVPKGATQGAIEWLVTPHALPGWRHRPVVQVSQVGYRPKQQKMAVIELDRRDSADLPVRLLRVSENGGCEPVFEKSGHDWGQFLRYRYLQLDFSEVEKPGMYVVQYGDSKSAVFQIGEHVFDRNAWQPTLEYFLPIQMCHMRVNDRYRVWHGWCHLDDARMAPINYNHFDGYVQGPSTLTKYQPGEHVPGLDRGGWHDAGDFDLRVESQSETVHGLALAYEAFHVDYDNTTIDQENRVVEIQRPDGKPDMLQQIEHGVLTIVGGYKSLGRLYRGIITPDKRTYTMLGDPANSTDNRVYDEKAQTGGKPPAVGLPGSPDDNWVFTENNPDRELLVASGLAAGSRALKTYNPALSGDCLRIAQELWRVTAHERYPGMRILLASELLLTTKDRIYADYLAKNTAAISQGFEFIGWAVGRTIPLVDKPDYRAAVETAAKAYRAKIDELGAKTPYGVPYEPEIWGAGWKIQRFGVNQYFLHTAFPEVFPDTYMLHALNFILGCHPGSNTASFVSGVGAKSMIPGYGFNRADGSYLPGGSGSGTALIRPDFPELLEWPYLWQQTEYVLGTGTTDYLFLALAAQHSGRLPE